MLRLLMSLTVVWIVGFLPVQAQAQWQRGPQPSGPAVAGDTVSYLRPGDVLRLRIWREPDMSGDFAVDVRGQVTLPRLGPIDVATIEPDSLVPRLVAAYSEYLNNPSIEIIPLRRVSVLGAVRQPGLYPIDPTMRLADVLALAGGTAGDGKQGKVELRRNGTQIHADLAETARVGNLPIRSGDQLFVPQRSWLSRNTWLVSTLLGASVTTMIALTR